MATLTANGGVLAQVMREEKTEQGETRHYHRALCASGWILERWGVRDTASGRPFAWPWVRAGKLKADKNPTEWAAHWAQAYTRKGWTIEKGA